MEKIDLEMTKKSVRHQQLRCCLLTSRATQTQSAETILLNLVKLERLDGKDEEGGWPGGEGNLRAIIDRPWAGCSGSHFCTLPLLHPMDGDCPLPCLPHVSSLTCLLPLLRHSSFHVLQACLSPVRCWVSFR